MSAARLTPDEDAELRRLHVLRRFGNVAHSIAGRYDELRRRDRRHEVRDPVERDSLSPSRARVVR